MPERQIPESRKTLYYCGMGLSILGLLLFLSIFLTFFWNFGNFDGFSQRTASFGIRGFLGIILMGVGKNMMVVAAKGLAGSGIVLDPEQARKDVEPWSRMGGGMVQDALSEVGVVKQLEDHLAAPQPAVKVRCRSCHVLNDETAKFCNHCGAAL